MKIDLLSEGLDAGHNTRAKLCAGESLEVQQDGSYGCLAEFIIEE